jgi:hypothetical protein
VKGESIMAYELLPAQENESGLFFRSDDEAAERCGVIGCMRADFGRTGKEFRTTWFDGQKRLKTYIFKREFDEVVNSLRNDGDKPPFASRFSLSVYCAENPGAEMPAGRGKGFRIRTLDFSYYVRCNPRYGDYDIALCAYDNRYLLPELAGKHELPRKCFCLLPSGNEMILIDRNKKEHTLFKTTGAPKDARLVVNEMNEAIGVTRAQEAAMLAGAMLGWNTPAAKPWNYEPDGTPRLPAPRKKDEPER